MRETEREKQLWLKHGFTILELLVVAAILATLAGLLLPTMAAAREAGRGANCTSNLRQLGVAFLLYTDDYAAFPGVGYGARPYSGDWVRCSGYYSINVKEGSLYTYTRNERIYVCLSDGRASTRNLSYSLNRLLDHRLATLARPSETLLLLEENEASVWGTGVNDAVWDVYTDVDRLATKHGGMGRVLWADGHVSSLRPERVARTNGEVPEVFIP